MKKIVLLAMLFVSVMANAQQSIPVKAWEVEARIGGTYPLSVYGDKAKINPSFGVEVRYNKPDSHWNYGAKLDLVTAGRDMELTTETIELKFRTISLSVLTDYNFRQGKKINPFAGIGLGIGKQDAKYDGSYHSDCNAAVVVTPRIGVEVGSNLRFTATGTLTRSDYSNIGITVGYVFGIGKK